MRRREPALNGLGCGWSEMPHDPVQKPTWPRHSCCQHEDKAQGQNYPTSLTSTLQLTARESLPEPGVGFFRWWCGSSPHWASMENRVCGIWVSWMVPWEAWALLPSLLQCQFPSQLDGAEHGPGELAAMAGGHHLGWYRAWGAPPGDPAPLASAMSLLSGWE